MSKEWESKKVSDFGEIITGSTPSTKISNYWNGDVPFYSPADFDGNTYCDNTERTITIKGLNTGREIRKDSVMFTCIGSIGKMAINRKKGITNQQINTIIINEEEYDYKFIYYLLLNNRERFISYAPMTTIQIVNKSDFGQFEFLTPPKPQQTKIAKILTTIDNVIEKTEEAIAKYEAIKQGMMHDLFTRGIGEDGQLRPTFEEAPELYKESALGWIPKEWEVKRFESITLKITDRDHFTPTYFEHGIPIISPKDFGYNDRISFAKCKYISKEAHTHNRKKTDLEIGDLVFTRIGAALGKVCIVEDWMPEFSILHSAAMIRPNNKIISSSYMMYFMKSSFFQSQIAKEIQSIGVPDLGLDKINMFKMFYPKKKEEQKQISNRIEKIDSLIMNEMEILSKQTQLKKGLMQDLLTGKVSVTP